MRVDMSVFNRDLLRPRRVYRTWMEQPYNGNISMYPPPYPALFHGEKKEVPLPVLQKNPSRSAPKSETAQSIVKNLQEYFLTSTLHGLRYVGDQSVSFVERLFWFCSFICAICFAVYFISNIFTKYNQNPVIISLNPTPTSLNSIPFPAITICSSNQAKRPEAEYILNFGTDAEKVMLDNYCGSNVAGSNSSSLSGEGTDWENMKNFILRLNPSCEEMLRVCLWRQEEAACDYVFNNALTDNGLCCTFNALPASYVYRYPKQIGGLNLTYPPEVDDWNPERGYAYNATIDALPRRAAGAGTHLGLTVVLDVQSLLYFCSATASIGFLVLLHNPLESPKMADFALLTPPGFEARIVIQPKISDATPQLEGIDMKKRLCYFNGERELHFFRIYTERNCRLECQANYTLTLCNCVPYYLPRDKYTKICGKTKEDCVSEAKDIMETANDDGEACNCIPACFEVSYEATASYGKLSNKFKVKEEIIRNESPEYFMNEMAVLHFYFIDTQFTRNTKSVIYGFSEFLSNTGGLLGLFMGFSFLSAVEIAYFISLRILCKLIRTKRTKEKKDQLKHKSTSVYPFAK